MLLTELWLLNCRAYVSSIGDAAEESTMSPTGEGLTSYGNTDTHAEAGAAGGDITASSGYGSKKAPDNEAGQVTYLSVVPWTALPI